MTISETGFGKAVSRGLSRVIARSVDTICETGRIAQGVKLIRLGEGDQVAAVAKILREEEE